MKNERVPILGDIENISELFSDFILCLSIITKGAGSRTLHPNGYYFIGGLRGKEEEECAKSYYYIDRKTYFLYCKTTEKTLMAANPYCVNGQVGSFEIVRWVDKALVLAVDREYIARPWIAFIPLNQIPETNKLPLHPN